MSLLGKAIAIAAEAFRNKTDMGGQPYIVHCLNVMYQMPESDSDLRIIAVLHDLVEDCPDWTFERLADNGFNERVRSALKLLTHNDGVPYDDYIDAIASTFIIGINDARLVKMADLRHNSDILRMKGVRQKDLDRIAKYHRAYAKLRDL